MKRFAKSVLMGTLIGGGPFLIATVPLAVMMMFDPHHDVSRSLYLAVLPLLVALVLVAAGGVVIGIPVYWTLKMLKAESCGLYTCLGLLFGAAIPLPVLLAIKAPEGYWLCLVGAGSGAATAHTWWRSRRAT